MRHDRAIPLRMRVGIPGDINALEPMEGTHMADRNLKAHLCADGTDPTGELELRVTRHWRGFNPAACVLAVEHGQDARDPLLANALGQGAEKGGIRIAQPLPGQDGVEAPGDAARVPDKGDQFAETCHELPRRRDPRLERRSAQPGERQVHADLVAPSCDGSEVSSIQERTEILRADEQRVDTFGCQQARGGEPAFQGRHEAVGPGREHVGAPTGAHHVLAGAGPSGMPTGQASAA